MMKQTLTECIQSNSNYSLKHVLIDCVDDVNVRQTFYNVNNLYDLVYKCHRRHNFEMLKRN